MSTAVLPLIYRCPRCGYSVVVDDSSTVTCTPCNQPMHRAGKHWTTPAVQMLWKALKA